MTLTFGLVSIFLFSYLSAVSAHDFELLERSPLPLGVIRRTLSGNDDVVSFDDMPQCAKQHCVPYSAESVGCIGKITRGCLCSNSAPINCAYSPCSWPQYDLASQWLGSICINVPFTSVANLPSCAKMCVTQKNVQSSCSLGTWECFCAADLYSDCLKSCTDDDKDKARKWKENACGSSASSGTANTDAQSITTTISAKVTVATEGGSLVTKTVEPAQTTVIANPNANQNNININTGGNTGGSGSSFSVNKALTMMGALFPAIVLYRLWQ